MLTKKHKLTLAQTEKRNSKWNAAQKATNSLILYGLITITRMRTDYTLCSVDFFCSPVFSLHLFCRPTWINVRIKYFCKYWAVQRKLPAIGERFYHFVSIFFWSESKWFFFCYRKKLQLQHSLIDVITATAVVNKKNARIRSQSSLAFMIFFRYFA